MPSAKIPHPPPPPKAPARSSKVRLRLKSDVRVIKQSPQLLHERAADAMRHMIIEGEILPGSRMPEVELCEMLGISRTPLREALKVLAAEGLVALMPQRGAMVTEPDVEELDATVEAVAHIEAAAARIACSKATDRELQAIGTLHKQMIEANIAGNAKRYFRSNQDFHSAIVRASRNAVLADVHKRVNAHLKRLRFQRMEQTSDRFRHSFIEQHQAIVEALKARNPDAASSAILAHLKLVGEMVGATAEET